MLQEIADILTARLWSPTLVDIESEKIVLCSGAYDAEDVVSEAVNVAGGAKPWLFRDVVKKEGSGGVIVGALLTAETTAIASWFTLFLHREIPTCALGDDVVNTAPLLADRHIYIGRIDFPACSDLGTGMSETEASPSTVGRLPKVFVCSPDSKDLYGVLVIRNALDLADSTVLNIKLTIEQY